MTDTYPILCSALQDRANDQFLAVDQSYVSYVVVGLISNIHCYI